MRIRSLRGLAQVVVVCLVAMLLEGSFEKAFAQSDLGRISGFITDPSGAAVPTAKAPGFQRYESMNNRLDTAADLLFAAYFIGGATSETVEVTASTVQLQT